MPSFDLPWWSWSFLIVPLIAIGYGLIAEGFTWLANKFKNTEQPFEEYDENGRWPG